MAPRPKPASSPLGRAFAAFWRGFGRVAARRRLMVALAGLLTFAACWAITGLRGHDPLPEVHDEHAYLLAGDTFARGRLTNPPHPLWKSLETFHVLQKPTYQAKYPPGQGLFLALGQALTGRPIVGVWISAALFASGLCWMLQAWFPPRWAVLGTLVGISCMVLSGRANDGGILAYWSQSYWGGAASALGGCLLLGGFRRILVGRLSEPTIEGDGRPARDLAWGASLALGAGASILALTRPFEGLLVCIPVALALAAWLILSRRATLGAKLLRVVLPAAAVIALAAGWMALYNHRVTGDPLQLPYMEYREQYQVLPIFQWQAVRPEPPGLNRQMLEYARWELAAGRHHSAPGLRAKEIYRTLVFMVGPVLAPAMILLLPWSVRSRWVLFALGAFSFFLAGSLLSTFFQTHYLSPGAGLVVILATAALRRIAGAPLRPRWAWRAVSVALVASTLASAGLAWVGEARARERMMEHWAKVRREVQTTLERQGGGHVVFVRYGPRHTSHVELVYNGAEVDASPVVWVRHLGAEVAARVRAHYPARTAWLLVSDDEQQEPTIYEFPAEGPAPPARGGH